MSALPEPLRSAAVIAGVAEYAHLPPLPAVARNRARLREALEDPGVWGLPSKQCHEVADPASSAELIDPVIRAARQARDTLIVYYAGHGFVDHKGELFLTLPESKNGWRHTAVPYDWLRQAILEHSRAQRRIVILDCCYSGRALEGMAEPAASLPAAASVNGTYVLTSAAENVQALSPKDEECTAFTGELAAVLREGVPDGEEFLTLDTVYGQVLHTLRAKGRPEPQEQDRGRIGRLPFVRNRQHGKGSTGPRTAPERLPGLGRRLPYHMTVVGSVLALSLAATGSVWWLTGGHEVPDSRYCSQRAALLDWSDDLDEPAHGRRRATGLSGLTVREGSHAWALAHTSPHKLYKLALGTEGKAEGVHVTGTQTLKDKDGAELPPKNFDGEAVALEKDGDSVLVASETDSSISRFDLDSGKQVSSLEVPEPFKDRARKNRGFESLALSPSGDFLYAATERHLAGDDTDHGKSLVRILRYRQTHDGGYEPDRQFAFETNRGMRLVSLAAGGGGALLTVQRGETGKFESTVRVHRVSLKGSSDVSGVRSLQDVPESHFADKGFVLDLSACPASGAGTLTEKTRTETGQKQSNPLVENVKGAALGSTLDEGEYKGRQVLYLVSDNSTQEKDKTRFYALAVDLF